MNIPQTFPGIFRRKIPLWKKALLQNEKKVK